MFALRAAYPERVRASKSWAAKMRRTSARFDAGAWAKTRAASSPAFDEAGDRLSALAKACFKIGELAASARLVGLFTKAMTSRSSSAEKLAASASMKASRDLERI